MAEFNIPEARTVSIGETVPLPEIRMDPGGRYWVECAWIRNGSKESGHWEIQNDSKDGAYTEWKKENWEQLFDPFNVTITRMTISKIG